MVQTASEKVLASRRMVLELLLAQAPAAEHLKEMAAAMGVHETRFNKGDPAARCILCGQCVRTCREVVGVSAISMAFRTPKKRVATPFAEQSEACIGCGSCVFICPTNTIAYTEKDGIRTVWGRKFELQPCSKCGNYIAPKAQLEHWAKLTGDPVESFLYLQGLPVGRQFRGEARGGITPPTLYGPPNPPNPTRIRIRLPRGTASLCPPSLLNQDYVQKLAGSRSVMTSLG